MIRKAKFENFKGLRDVEITFESRFTVLVGPNGTGKTSVLQGLQLAERCVAEPVQEVFAPFTPPADARNLLIRVLDESGWGYQVDYPNPPSPASKASVFVAEVMKTGLYVVQQRQPLTRIHRPHPPTLDPKKSIRFGPFFFPKFSADKIATPSETKRVPPRMASNGEGTPSVLTYHFFLQDGIFQQIEMHMRQLLPNVTKLRVEEVVIDDSPSKKVLLFDTASATRIPAEQMSDGTLYILALIVAVLGPHRPKTLLIDDIDHRLHPKAQYELVTLLKKFLAEFPDLQIIATSHSPYILDRLEMNEVLVTDLAEDGSVVVAPLTAHPSYEKWKDAMTPGEFWSHTGEGWLKHFKREPATP